ncbi:TIGR02302 family protein [Pararhizobium sp.]|uniref:TIGR02302 family protein n=1 Tax=Pararhizobium sp. TaxID=1977563 RepID=UPI002719AE62|nr:TIGR02302 family protein [Pararhizobium sp.]MDO9417445.1 TIGR02302 family protein [Pararhizobium sp.]
MTDAPKTAAGPSAPRTPLERMLSLKRFLARIVLVAENIIPRSLPLAGVVLLFVSVSWFGLFRVMPAWLHVLVLLGFAAAAVFVATRLFHVHWPQASEADRMLEERNALPHQAIGVQEDRPATGSAFGQALWLEHQKRMAGMIGALEAGTPKPDIARHDPYALRAVPVLLAVIAFAYSYSNRAGSISEAFSLPQEVSQTPGLRIDAWVTPPAYTGRPPVFLTARADETPAAAGVEAIRIPQFSDLTVRITGGGDESVTYDLSRDPGGNGQPIVIPVQDLKAGAGGTKTGEDTQTPVTDIAAATPTQSRNHVFKIAKDGTLKVGGQSWTFVITPDTVPEIAFNGIPKQTVNAALEIGFMGTDDYGIRSAWAEIKPLEEVDGAKPLYPLPEYRLDLPRSKGGRDVKGLTSRNLSEHPLSGKKVRVTLVAKDAAGQEGRSAPHDMILPARAFIEPLAGAIAEQRQIFALDINQLPRAIELNEGLMIRPEDTIPNLTHFLLMQSVQNRMKLARNEEMLRGASDHLWEVALGIEGGDLSLADRKLRDAQQKLSDALENGASDEEIARLMDELKQAMKEYMEALARQAMKNQQSAQSQVPRENVVRQQDLEKMMKQIEDLAKSGSRDQAKQLLAEMQRMMNNMQAGRQPQQQQQGEENSAMREQMDKLGKLMQDQQKLMEQTFGLDQAMRDRMQRGDPLTGENDELFGQDMPQQPGDSGEQQQGENGEKPGGENPTDQMTAEQLRDALKKLQAQQDALGKQLSEVQKGLEGMGIKPGKGFGKAQGEMKGAAGALGKGQGEQAVGGQGRALQALREGAQDMMQQMQAQGEGKGQGQGQGQGVPQYGQNGRDPLGRSRQNTGNQDFGGNVEIPDEIDIQRSREIREQIRKMLGSNATPELERQYLERLLDIR